MVAKKMKLVLKLPVGRTRPNPKRPSIDARAKPAAGPKLGALLAACRAGTARCPKSICPGVGQILPLICPRPHYSKNTEAQRQTPAPSLFKRHKNTKTNTLTHQWMSATTISKAVQISASQAALPTRVNGIVKQIAKTQQQHLTK